MVLCILIEHNVKQSTFGSLNKQVKLVSFLRLRHTLSVCCIRSGNLRMMNIYRQKLPSGSYAVAAVLYLI